MQNINEFHRWAEANPCPKYRKAAIAWSFAACDCAVLCGLPIDMETAHMIVEKSNGILSASKVHSVHYVVAAIRTVTESENGVFPWEEYRGQQQGLN